MKTVLSLVIALLTTMTIQAQGIDFFQGTWEEALAAAKKEQKLIFMDAYAVWCGPCKRMDAQVFSRSEAGDFYNKHFINVKMDMEKGEGLEIRKKYPVRAYPTLLFIDYDGTLVKRSVGAKPIEAFVALGQDVLSSIDRTGPFVEQYEKGKRDPEFMYDYIKALNQSGKSSLKVANDYLRDQEDVTTPENLRIIYEAATEVDSRIFKMLMENREAVEELMPDVNMDEKIMLAAENTLDKALEFDSEMLLNEAKKKVAEYDPDHEDAFAAKADMAFAKKQGDTNDYEKALKEYLKKGMEQDTPATTDRVASMALRSYPKEEGVVSLVLDILADNAERAGEAKYHLSHAIALAFSGDKQEAATVAERAFAMAKGKDPITQMEARKLLDNLAND